jgi:hypothetical protein
VPRNQWALLFEQQGMPADCLSPRIEMLDGFNSGFIDFEQGHAKHFTGQKTLDDVIGELIQKH